MRELGSCYNRFKGDIKTVQMYMEERNVEMNVQMQALALSTLEGSQLNLYWPGQNLEFTAL